MARRKRKPANRASRPVASGDSTAPAAITAPPEILDLVDRFRRNRDAYRDPAYKEAPLRREFLDPFFEALGWDVQNRQGHAEAYKDVVHEDALKVGGATNAPDYGFRIGGQRKFFVEAKKPSVDIAAALHPSYQLRRYAWSAKLPLSILTDFEEFAVYDCRIRPKPTDKASAARVLYLAFEDYPARWTDIAEVFSKDAVLKGSFDRYAAKSRKRGTATVDQAFLAEIETWRDGLARNLALRNLGLSVRDLNFAVQRTIDRIIFLRMGEDRGAEPYGELLALVNGPKIYPRLLALFERADDKYNSGLFYFRPEKGRPQPDELTPRLKIDDGVLKTIIRDLYYPQSPYEFSVLGADILGQVYEQFLGKVIRLTPGHRAKVEEKPEVKKAGGVYYTPTYIVRYIVENTVGRLIGGKTPRQISRLRVLDPACGSGSFLIGAYESLLDYHRDWYVEHDPPKHRKKIYQGAGGQWFLTIQEKKRILLNNIYGVDIDGQAVEVTKLSLLLKVLEGENQDSLGRQMRFLHERALPDLASNIKCGNSLIGTDFFQGRQMDLFDDDAVHRVNAFDWAAQFPAVLGPNIPKARRGFDGVIGNPPYLFITEQQEQQKQYYSKTYTAYRYRYDVYGLFIEKAVAHLLAHKGRLGLIIPHTLLNNDSFVALRRFLLKNSVLNLIVDLGPGVFHGAKNETMLLFATKAKPKRDTTCQIIKSDKDLGGLGAVHDIGQQSFLALPNAAFLVSARAESVRLLAKLRSLPARLGDYCTINQGLRTGDNKRFLSASRQLKTQRPAVGGRHIGRYHVRKHIFVRYEPGKLDAPRNESIFTSPEKVIVQEIRNITLPRRIIATYDRHRLYCLQSTNVINLRGTCHPPPDLKYLLGLLNSRLINWFFRTSFPSNNHIASNQLAQVPIVSVDLCDDSDKARHEQMVNRVERMLDLNKRLAKAKNPDEKTCLQRLINATDREIDQLVYQLYELTAEEIALVEASA